MFPKFDIYQERWYAELPKTLTPIIKILFPPELDAKLTVQDYGLNFEGSQHPSFPEIASSLKQEIPDGEKRIRTLLKIWGSGLGPWSCFLLQEAVTEIMLLEESPDNLIFVASKTDLTKEETEGAARLLAGWNFKQRFPLVLKTLPAELKKHLLDHVLQNPLMDKDVEAEWRQDRRDRALAAFR